MPRTGGKSRIAPDEDSPEWAHLVEQFQAPGTDLGQLARENGYKNQGSLYNVMSRAGILRTMTL